MGRPRWLVLHKDEWQRLKKKANPSQTPRHDDKEQYFKELNEISQKWLKSWPDTKQGHLVQLAREKKQQRAEQIELVKSFTKIKPKHGSEAVINGARQLIFESSCYGQRLKSSLLESKALEENDAQILFKNELKQISLKMDVNKPSAEGCSFDLDKHHAQENQYRQLQAKQLAQFNNNVHKSLNEKLLKSKAKELQDRVEDAIAIERMVLIENGEKERCKSIEQQTFIECQAEQTRLKTARARRDERDQHAADRYKMQQDILRNKIQKIYKEVYHGKADSTIYQNHYKLLETIKKQEQKQYEEFIEKGITQLEERNKQESAKKNELKAQGRLVMVVTPSPKEACKELCSAKQCILPKCGKLPRRKRQNVDITTNLETPLEFLSRRNTLAEELRKRERAPSPWTGAKAAHAQFAQQADDTLKLCKYKSAARKVVDDYIKLNGLNAAALPIPSYQDF